LLRNTFVHVPGINESAETDLWRSGCHEWDHLLAEPDRFSYGEADRDKVKRHIEKSEKALVDLNHQFFRRSLGMKEAWRAFPDFRESCVYLDIETDGGNGTNSVTTIGLYDGKTYTCLVQGQDLENFRDIISHYGMIVTFFGAGFDIPVLLKRFRGLKLDQIHIDLCPTLKRVGVHGGLKKIEKVFGIERSPETEGLTGYDAVLLWRRHIRLHDDAALERLIAYNREDVVNLEKLAELAYSRLRRQTLEHVLNPSDPSLFDDVQAVVELTAPPWDEEKTEGVKWRSSKLSPR
jgi:uncharacterized protein YprB with RNaseH-like and TPR domain